MLRKPRRQEPDTGSCRGGDQKSTTAEAMMPDSILGFASVCEVGHMRKQYMECGSYLFCVWIRISIKQWFSALPRYLGSI